MSQLGETLACLFQDFNVFGAEVCHWELDIVETTLEHSSKRVFCFRVIYHSILAFGASD